MAEEKKKLPEGYAKRLRALLGELEAAEKNERIDAGEIELRINEAEALWFVSYKTSAQ